MMALRAAGSKALLNEVRRQQKGYRRAAVRALNKTATQARNQSARTVRETLNIKAGDAKKLLTLQRARPSRLRSGVGATYNKIPLIRFNSVRQLKRGGVSVRVRKDQPPLRLRNAFIATMPSGHKGVFYRKGRRRLPILEAHGPSLQTVFGEKLPALVAKTEPLLFKLLDREINYEFNVKGRR